MELEFSTFYDTIHIGTGIDITIARLAEMIREVVGFAGGIRFNAAMPDGTMEKCLDVSRLTSLGWQAKIELGEGLQQAYRWFVAKKAG